MTSSIAALFFLRNPFSAGVGLPFASYAAFFGGPFTSCSRSGSLSGSWGRKKMIRRGVVVTVTFSAIAASFSRNVFCAASCIDAGISSVNSSKKYSAIRADRRGRLSSTQRKSEGFARGEELGGAGDGELAHALDHGNAFRNRDRAAGVERVERVRALECEVIRGKHDVLFEAALRF